MRIYIKDLNGLDLASINRDIIPRQGELIEINSKIHKVMRVIHVIHYLETGDLVNVIVG